MGLSRAVRRAQTQLEEGMSGIKETELYAPVKAWLQGLGFEVKAEVGACGCCGLP